MADYIKFDGSGFRIMKKFLIILFLSLGLTFNVFAGVDFNGDGDNINCGSATAIDLTTMGDVTACGLVHIDDQTKDREIIGQLSAGQGLELRFDTGDDTWHFNGYSGSQWDYAKYDTVTPPTNGVVYLVCGVLDGNTLKVYQNGTVGATTDATTGLADNSVANVLIGKHDNQDRHWDGEIYWVAIWDVVLTAGEMSLMATSKVKTIALQIQPANLQAFWPLDELAAGTGINTITFVDRAGTNNGTGVDGDADSAATAESYSSYPE